MSGLGFLALGASAGVVCGFVVSKAGRSIGLGFLVAALIPMILSGAVVLMTPQLRESKWSGFYAVGLLLSLMWQQVGPLLMDIVRLQMAGKILVSAYGIVTLALSIFAIVCVLFL